MRRMSGLLPVHFSGAILLAILGIAGCTKEQEARTGGAAPATPPAHPAMTESPSKGAETPGAETQGLPPGHPPIPSGMAGGAETEASEGAQGLPPGHPPLPSGMTGGSAAEGSAGTPALPAGHPPLPSGMTGGAGDASPSAGTAGAAPSAADVAARLERFGVKLEVPEGWEQVASRSSMRLATFRLPRAEGDAADGEVSVIPALGSVEANIQRWSGQFQEKPAPETSTREVGGIQVTVTEMEGTFVGAGGAQPDTRLEAAILRVPGVDQLLFIKAWGPTRTMEKWKPSFGALIDSVERAGS